MPRTLWPIFFLNANFVKICENDFEILKPIILKFIKEIIFYYEDDYKTCFNLFTRISKIDN